MTVVDEKGYNCVKRGGVRGVLESLWMALLDASPSVLAVGAMSYIRYPLSAGHD